MPSSSFIGGICFFINILIFLVIILWTISEQSIFFMKQLTKEDVMKRMNFPGNKKSRRTGAVERLEKSLALISKETKEGKEKTRRVEEIIENTKDKR